MTIPCTCPSCGRATAVEWSQIGKKIACGACGKGMTVPAPREIMDEFQGPAPPMRIACPSCGRKYAIKPELAGKKIRCSGCGAGVRVPQEGDSVLTQSSRPVLKAFGDDASTPPPRTVRARSAQPVANLVAEEPVGAIPLLDVLATDEGVKRSSRVETILPSRSEAMEQVRQKVSEEQEVAAEKQRIKSKKKKRKKQTGFFDPKETMKLVGGAAVFVIVLALLAWGVPDIRFPLGGVLCLMGFVVYLLGLAALRQMVAEEGPFKALMFRFIPPYQWWYVATHWSDTRDYVAFFAAGLVILGVGGAVIKTSDIGQKAAKADRALEKRAQGGQDQIPPPVIIGAEGGDE